LIVFIGYCKVAESGGLGRIVSPAFDHRAALSLLSPAPSHAAVDWFDPATEYSAPGALRVFWKASRDSPRIDFSYQDEIHTYAINSSANRIDDYTVANARITWRSPSIDWEAALEVTNLTDEFYFTNIFEQYDSSGTVAGTPGLPRMWAITLRRNF
jgi:outer membrane receptor protein involved in Fe transport